MRKLLLMPICIIVGGYVIYQVVSHNDPAMNITLADLTIKEINQGIPTVVVASGDDSAFEEPDFEEMAIEE
ncbi:MAG: hypothetical protein H8E36_15290 [Rhodospirillaceae bacterium]|nr:hypothetical protein [Rhodospirillaceae bacterium]MBL6929889.1 hypothetical protein [Rhodospirillales bacterium]